MLKTRFVRQNWLPNLVATQQQHCCFLFTLDMVHYLWKGLCVLYRNLKDHFIEWSNGLFQHVEAFLGTALGLGYLGLIVLKKGADLHGSFIDPTWFSLVIEGYRQVVTTAFLVGYSVGFVYVAATLGQFGGTQGGMWFPPTEKKSTRFVSQSSVGRIRAQHVAKFLGVLLAFVLGVATQGVHAQPASGETTKIFLNTLQRTPIPGLYARPVVHAMRLEVNPALAGNVGVLQEVDRGVSSLHMYLQDYNRYLSVKGLPGNSSSFKDNGNLLSIRKSFESGLQVDVEKIIKQGASEDKVKLALYAVERYQPLYNLFTSPTLFPVAPLLESSKTNAFTAVNQLIFACDTHRGSSNPARSPLQDGIVRGAYDTGGWDNTRRAVLGDDGTLLTGNQPNCTEAASGGNSADLVFHDPQRGETRILVQVKTVSLSEKETPENFYGGLKKNLIKKNQFRYSGVDVLTLDFSINPAWVDPESRKKQLKLFFQVSEFAEGVRAGRIVVTFQGEWLHSGNVQEFLSDNGGFSSPYLPLQDRLNREVWRNFIFESSRQQYQLVGDFVQTRSDGVCYMEFPQRIGHQPTFSTPWPQLLEMSSSPPDLLEGEEGALMEAEDSVRP